jgi:hypothetical protein
LGSQSSRSVASEPKKTKGDLDYHLDDRSCLSPAVRSVIAAARDAKISIDVDATVLPESIAAPE